MIDGFWTVEFQDIPGFVGGGVVILSKGKVLGGDSQYYYTGAYTERDERFEAKVEVNAFVRQPASVFGTNEQKFGLTLSGRVAPAVIEAKGERPENPRMILGMRLTRRGELPA